MATCSWPINDTQHLDFEIVDNNNNWNDVPGLYIFTYQNGANWFPLYVGQAESFQSRLPNHERLDEAVQNGATHIHALVVHDQAQRDQWEQMLIQHLHPPMNTQHR